MLFHQEPFDIAFHCAFVPLNVIEVNFVQLENAEIPMLVTLTGIVIEVKPVQYWNAESPMLVTLSGIMIEIKSLRP